MDKGNKMRTRRRRRVRHNIIGSECLSEDEGDVNSSMIQMSYTSNVGTPGPPVEEPFKNAIEVDSAPVLNIDTSIND